MDAIRTVLVAMALSCAAVAWAGGNGDASGRFQVGAEVLGRCEFTADPARATTCNRGVAFVEKAPVIERTTVEGADGAAPVAIKQIEF